MNAPERFAKWMCGHIANDNKFGRAIYRYHPRSDAHSKMLCGYVIEDIIQNCEVLRQHLDLGEVVYSVNSEQVFANGKKKALDLAIGKPVTANDVLFTKKASKVGFTELRLACEAKQCMTEHSKSKPRIFDELSSSHEIVHQGDSQAIAGGLTVVNIAKEFTSPTRQMSAEGDPIKTLHKQPGAAIAMIEHLKGLKMRDEPGQVGFDAFATIVIDCDNIGDCTLVTDHPAPQPGEMHHYGTFLQRIIDFYVARYG